MVKYTEQEKGWGQGYLLLITLQVLVGELWGQGCTNLSEVRMLDVDDPTKRHFVSQCSFAGVLGNIRSFHLSSLQELQSHVMVSSCNGHCLLERCLSPLGGESW